MINIKNFYSSYLTDLNDKLNKVDFISLDKSYTLLEKTIKKKKNIFVCGNGGSASVANHFLCDFNKGIKISSNRAVKPKIISLSNSIELMTAISNDISYNDVFANQLSYGLVEKL